LVAGLSFRQKFCYAPGGSGRGYCAWGERILKNAKRRERCDRLLGQLEVLLAKCPNVAVEDHELKSADETAISVLDYYQPWISII
jgi:hypothetical protein